jgi:hypothetical protein
MSDLPTGAGTGAGPIPKVGGWVWKRPRGLKPPSYMGMPVAAARPIPQRLKQGRKEIHYVGAKAPTPRRLGRGEGKGTIPTGAGTGAGPTPKVGEAGYWPIGRCWEGNARPTCAGTPSTGLCTI